MSEIDRRISAIKDGSRPEWASASDMWFAIYPVRIGALGTGPLRFGCWLWRNQCCGVTIYQDPEDAKRTEAFSKWHADMAQKVKNMKEQERGGVR